MMNRILTGVLAFAAICGASGAQAVPIQSLAGLSSVTVWERTGPGPNPFVFAPNSAAITTMRADPLGPGNADIGTAEAYDIFYSDANGTLNANGAYLTITAVYPFAVGGALNVAGVQLNFGAANASLFGGAGSELANVVTHVVALGASANAASAASAVDGVSSTHSSIGDTNGLTPGQRLVLTVGFESSAIETPVPAALGLIGSGIFGIALMRRRTA
jgi:hypothetical protein